MKIGIGGRLAAATTGLSWILAAATTATHPYIGFAIAFFSSIAGFWMGTEYGRDYMRSHDIDPDDPHATVSIENRQKEWNWQLIMSTSLVAGVIAFMLIVAGARIVMHGDLRGFVAIMVAVILLVVAGGYVRLRWRNV